jgi:GDP-mannose transporter
MRKKIKAAGFSDWDSMFYNNLLSIPVLAVFSLLVENWGYDNLIKNL